MSEYETFTIDETQQTRIDGLGFYHIPPQQPGKSTELRLKPLPQVQGITRECNQAIEGRDGLFSPAFAGGLAACYAALILPVGSLSVGDISTSLFCRASYSRWQAFLTARYKAPPAVTITVRIIVAVDRVSPFAPATAHRPSLPLV